MTGPTTTSGPPTTAGPTPTIGSTTTAGPAPTGPTTTPETTTPAVTGPTTTSGPTTTPGPVPTGPKTTLEPVTTGPTTTAGPTITPGPVPTGPTTSAGPTTTPGPVPTGPTTTAGPKPTPGPVPTGPTTTAGPTTPGPVPTGPTTTAGPTTTGPSINPEPVTPGPTTTARPAPTPVITTAAAPVTPSPAEISTGPSPGPSTTQTESTPAGTTSGPSPAPPAASTSSPGPTATTVAPSGPTQTTVATPKPSTSAPPATTPVTEPAIPPTTTGPGPRPVTPIAVTPTPTVGPVNPTVAPPVITTGPSTEPDTSPMQGAGMVADGGVTPFSGSGAGLVAEGDISAVPSGSGLNDGGELLPSGDGNGSGSNAGDGGGTGTGGGGDTGGGVVGGSSALTTKPPDKKKKLVLYFSITITQTTIVIIIGKNLVLTMIVQKVQIFVFYMQVESTHKSSTTYKSAKVKTKNRGTRQVLGEGTAPDAVRRVEAERGNTTSTFYSELRSNENATSTKAENVSCMYTMTLTIMKVKFTYKNGTQYPCDVKNQANASPPYLEIVDQFNVTTRYCSVDSNKTLVSFGDEVEGQLVTDDTVDLNDLIPDIEIVQSKNDYCCGGVFYTRYGDNLETKDHYATSSNYPQPYLNNMRCPYVFRCIPVPPAKTCMVQVDFIDFQLDSPNRQAAQQLAMFQMRYRRQANTGTSSSSNVTSVVPANQGFSQCTAGDFIRVATCGSITGTESQLFCSNRRPFKSFTSGNEVLVYFQSDATTMDKGYVVSYVSLDTKYGAYTEQELNATCRCGSAIPARVRDSSYLATTGIKPKKKATKGTKKSSFKSKRQSRKNHTGKKKKNTGKKLKNTGKKKRKTKAPGKKIRQKGTRNRKGTGRTRSKREAGEGAKKIRRKLQGDGNGDGEGQGHGQGGRRRGTARRTVKKVRKDDQQLKKGHLKTKRVLGVPETRINKGSKITNKTETTFVVTIVQRKLSLIKTKKPKPTKKAGGGRKRRTTVAAGKHRVKRQGPATTQKGKKKTKKNKSKGNKYKVARQCTGTVVNENFVLTSTTCCTTCTDIWVKKYKSKQQTTASQFFAIRTKRSAEEKKPGKNNGRKDSSKDPNKKKGQGKNDNNDNSTGNRHKEEAKGDSGTNTKRGGRDGNKRQRPQEKDNKPKKGGGEKKAPRKKGGGGGDGAKPPKEPGARQSGTTSKEDKKKQRQKNQKKKQQQRKKQQQQKNKNKKRLRYRAPKKTDIFILVGLYEVKPKKGSVAAYTKNIVKPKSIYIPEECYKKMVTAKTNKDMYEVSCPVLIRTGKPMALGANIQSLCLPAFDTFDMTTSLGASVGYGKKNLDTKAINAVPKVLTNINYLSASECMKKLKKVLDEDMFCTKAVKGSMCSGDWGSPLLLYRPSSDGHGEHISAFSVLAGTGCPKRKKKGNKGNKKPGKTTKRMKKPPGGPTKGKRIKKKTTPGNGNKRKIVRKTPGEGKAPAGSGPKGARAGRRKRLESNSVPEGNNAPLRRRVKEEDTLQRMKRQADGKEKDKKKPKNKNNPRKNKNSQRSRKNDTPNGEHKKPREGKGDKAGNANNNEVKRKKTGNGNKADTKETRSGKKRVKNVRKTGIRKVAKPIVGRPSDADEIILDLAKGKAIYTRQTSTKEKKKPKQKKQPKKYNKLYSNKKGIDVWTKLSPYMNWIIQIVFEGQERLLCQRPLDFSTTPMMRNTTLVEKCYDPPAREGGTM